MAQVHRRVVQRTQQLAKVATSRLVSLHLSEYWILVWGSMATMHCNLTASVYCNLSGLRSMLQSSPISLTLGCRTKTTTVSSSRCPHLCFHKLAMNPRTSREAASSGMCLHQVEVHTGRRRYRPNVRTPPQNAKFHVMHLRSEVNMQNWQPFPTGAPHFAAAALQPRHGGLPTRSSLD